MVEAINAKKPNEDSDSFTSNWDECVENFDDFPLKTELLRGIYGIGFEAPSLIQQRAIVPLLKKYDVIAQASSGTGKTSAYLIAILNLVDSLSLNTQAMILVPTRELACGVHRLMQCLGEYLNIKILTLVGGVQISQNKKQLSEGAQIIIGTPGRINDFIKKGLLKVEYLKIIILDELDEILSRGFREILYNIFHSIPHDAQIGFFSCCVVFEILKMSEIFMKTPVKIKVKSPELTLDGIKQFYIALEIEEWKLDAINELFMNMEVQQCVVYCNSKAKAVELTTFLRGRGYSASTFVEENNTMREFGDGGIRILVLTDLEIGKISNVLVINYDLPLNKEKYILRIGRSGRFGRRGTAINIVTPSDMKTIQEIEKYYNTRIEEMPLDVTDLF